MSLCPAGTVDDEIPSDLSLAQKAKGFTTTAVANRWCRQSAEQEMRDNIAELRAKMMSQAGNEAANTYKLSELMRHLQVLIFLSTLNEFHPMTACTVAKLHTSR